MKIKHCLSFLLFVMCNICLYPQAQVQMLDQAIIASAVRLSRDLPANATAAIIDFSTASAELNNYVVKELNGAILRHRRIVPVTLSQSQIQNISLEMRYGTGKELTDESVQAIGKVLGVQYLITGTIESYLGNYTLIFNVADTVDTKNRFRYTAPVDLRNDVQLTLLISDLRNLFTDSTVERKATVTRVIVSHEDIDFINGKKYKFSAIVEGTDDPPQDVTWSVTGSTSDKTVISSKGALTIASDETSTEMTIQAVSQFNTEVSETITVAVEILPPPKNRFSGEISILGFGLRYERSISDVFALGASVFWQTLEDSVDAGILASARLFPGDSIFFLELGLGYGYMERSYLYKFNSGWRMIEDKMIYKISGLMINPAIGLRLGRNTRGFFADVFFSVPIVIGERDLIEGNIDAGFRCGIGLGGAW